MEDNPNTPKSRSLHWLMLRAMDSARMGPAHLWVGGGVRGSVGCCDSQVIEAVSHGTNFSTAATTVIF
jgi:hypothetical protein